MNVEKLKYLDKDNKYILNFKFTYFTYYCFNNVLLYLLDK